MNTHQNNGLLSVVLPAFNEQASIQRAAETITGILSAERIPHELIFVDDGSKDGTWDTIQAQTVPFPQVRGVRFSRNFGKEAAIFAGLAQSAGACTVVLDCDLQHPPEKIVEMYRLWEQGYQVIEGVKLSRGKENPLHTLAAKGFYSIISRATGIDMSRASDFKLLDRRAVDTLLAMREKNAFFRALSSWIRLRMDHLDSPSSRGWTSNSTSAVRKPIQEDRARKKAFFSRMASRVSTARRSRSLKSEARDMSMPVARLMME